VVAALFNPMRRRIQDWVDRRFNRSRYDAQRICDDFAQLVRDEMDLDRIVEDWVDVSPGPSSPRRSGYGLGTMPERWHRSDQQCPVQ